MNVYYKLTQVDDMHASRKRESLFLHLLIIINPNTMHV